MTRTWQASGRSPDFELEWRKLWQQFGEKQAFEQLPIETAALLVHVGTQLFRTQSPLEVMETLLLWLSHPELSAASSLTRSVLACELGAVLTETGQQEAGAEVFGAVLEMSSRPKKLQAQFVRASLFGVCSRLDPDVPLAEPLRKVAVMAAAKLTILPHDLESQDELSTFGQLYHLLY